MKQRHFAGALAAGSIAGATAWCLDQLLAWLTIGDFLPTAPRFVLAYLLTGAALGCLVGVFAGRLENRWPLYGAIALAMLYMLPIFERVHQALAPRWSVPWLFASLVLVGYCVMAWWLGKLAGHGVAAGILISLLAASGLAANRNLVDQPLSKPALVLDVSLLLLIICLALVVRWRGWRTAVVTASAIVGVCAALLRPADRNGADRPGTSAKANASPSTAAEVSKSLSKSVAASADGDRAHLILIVLDTLRGDVFDDLIENSQEGRDLAAAMAGSAWFSRAHAAAPWTAPSMGSILTGLYPQEHGFGAGDNGDDPNRPLRRLADSVPTLATGMADRGYHTEAIVTNPLLHPVSGIARGFEHYEILGGPTVKMPLLTALVRLGWLRREFYQPATAVTRRLRSRLPVLKASGPMFLWLHLMDPHLPLYEHPQLPDERDGDDGVEDLPPDERLYRNETRFAFAQLKVMIEELDQAGLWQSSLVIVVADHGEMFPSDGHDNGIIEKTTGQPKNHGHGHALYDELMRIPLVIKPPGGLAADRRVDALVSHTDLHDTVADMLKLDIPRVGQDRITLAPWLVDPLITPEERPQVLLGGNQHGPPMQGLRDQQFKLIHQPRGQLFQLYDMLADPAEQLDLTESQPAQREGLLQRLRAAWKTMQTPETVRDLELDAETRERLEALGYL